MIHCTVYIERLYSLLVKRKPWYPWSILSEIQAAFVPVSESPSEVPLHGILQMSKFMQAASLRILLIVVA
ncbi:hypothetical protein DCAR_0205264 [Daucus carota subsp. sativus]|uniref:Uncharacterized protein n=1 Tax=Daucus carota subsp. sativus TaxID=79200 RepID=A0A175YBE5_DAUCS|nr:hypothetical protein DCAR_0205264 [Daucus carota subsp. sativus]